MNPLVTLFVNLIWLINHYAKNLTQITSISNYLAPEINAYTQLQKFRPTFPIFIPHKKYHKNQQEFVFELPIELYDPPQYVLEEV